MTIGKSLQSKRLEKKLSLTDVSHSLKIDEKTLQQIEADNFTGLNPVVVRSYIRQYASLLGLDGAKLLDAYTKSAAQAKAPATQQAAPVQKLQQAAAPAPKKKTEAEIKLAKAQKAVANSHSVRGLKSIFNLFDKINLDKFLKYGIWVIMGLAVVGSVAKGFTTAASKISTHQSSSVSSSSSQDKKQPPKKDDQPSSPAPDDQSSQSSAQSSSSQADEANSSSSSSAQKASSASSAEQSSSSSASSQSSQAEEASSSSENATE
ncbi:LysM domain protein [Lactobacillus equicursoris DSM 19284 = JCM 14600 = CIP 110162]|uniref:Lysm domain protein n=1 Tax=Lactobacillus equicursoris DSM 19284 = JCM 14600 = CIP 110162 TaxID=1293597 RepID=K0NYZ0_9LACO|nr:helix-turn-helix transcriptional regulator [Lactobacillus equicursoris]KRK99988.1 lysm domain protein [Lactobacillus equicursoris DSM 19284 = JCM 14600 = CIP 110162]CCK85215.1 LysM domain protein [Lactobacillus equicursoris DSM 19284 = JCM 14600 = CIP 110162]